MEGHRLLLVCLSAAEARRARLQGVAAECCHQAVQGGRSARAEPLLSDRDLLCVSAFNKPTPVIFFLSFSLYSGSSLFTASSDFLSSSVRMSLHFLQNCILPSSAAAGLGCEAGC